MRTCEYCGAELVRRAKERSREWGRRRFCGYSCSALSRRPQQAEKKRQRDMARQKNCARCGVVFLPLLRNDRPSPYCSRDCANQARADDKRRDRWHEEDRGFQTPCWIWEGGIRPGKYNPTIFYGRCSVNNRTVLAHRYVYEKLRGPIPGGLHLDHLCEVTTCVNPDHLDPVTRGENTRRSWERGRHDAKRKVA